MVIKHSFGAKLTMSYPRSLADRIIVAIVRAKHAVAMPATLFVCDTGADPNEEEDGWQDPMAAMMESMGGMEEDFVPGGDGEL